MDHITIRSQSGIAALITVVIIGAVSLIMIKSVSLLGLGGLEMAYIHSRSGEAMAIAEGCAEETIRRFQLNPDYAANNLSLALGNGNCLINTAANGSQRTVTSQGSVDGYYKTIRAVVTIDSGSVNVDSWQEISG